MDIRELRTKKLSGEQFTFYYIHEKVIEQHRNSECNCEDFEIHKFKVYAQQNTIRDDQLKRFRLLK